MWVHDINIGYQWREQYFMQCTELDWKIAGYYHIGRQKIESSAGLREIIQAVKGE
jgi:hypothetical protein